MYIALQVNFLDLVDDDLVGSTVVFPGSHFVFSELEEEEGKVAALMGAFVDFDVLLNAMERYSMIPPQAIKKARTRQQQTTPHAIWHLSAILKLELLFHFTVVRVGLIFAFAKLLNS